MKEVSNRFVLSLGGSLIAPGPDPDHRFLEKFRDIITTRLNTGYSFYIIVGGGYPARSYANAFNELGLSSKLQDHIGIFATHFNAYYVSLAFGFPPEHKVVLKTDRLFDGTNIHITGAGLTPGQSTDTVATQVALAVNSNSVINLSNIEYVYNNDPKTNPDAEVLRQLTWQQYLDIIPSDWQPGLSTPFDPVASRLAMANNIKVSVLGPDLDNLEALLDGRDYNGSIISNHDQA